MNDPLCACGVQGTGNFDGQRHQPLQPHRPTDQMLQDLSIEKLHRDERLPILLPYVVDGADAWMVERRSRLCFMLEADQYLPISGNFIRQELQSNKTVKPCVFGLIDYPHSAAAKLLDDAVVRDGLANHEAETSAVGDDHGSSLPGSSQRARPSSERNEYAGRALRARKNSFPERHPGQQAVHFSANHSLFTWRGSSNGLH